MNPYILEAFTKKPFGGNPAGAVIRVGGYAVIREDRNYAAKEAARL